MSASSSGVRRGSSSRSNSSAHRRRARRSVLRRASVGWAVSTGTIDKRPTSASRSRLRPWRLSVVTAPAIESSTAPPRAARLRLATVRTRLRSSARFTSWKYRANARTTASTRSTSSAVNAASSPSAAEGSSPCRAAIAARRIRSTSSKSSSPACSTITWPSRAPSSFTSRASGSRAPELPIPAGSARTAAFGAGRRAVGAVREVRAVRALNGANPQLGRNLPAAARSLRLYRETRDDHR
jgi:hypothetical protein